MRKFTPEYLTGLEASPRESADMMRTQYGSKARLSYDEAADVCRAHRELLEAS